MKERRHFGSACALKGFDNYSELYFLVS